MTISPFAKISLWEHAEKTGLRSACVQIPTDVPGVRDLGKILNSAASVSSSIKCKSCHLANENAQKAFKEVGRKENAQEFTAIPAYPGQV